MNTLGAKPVIAWIDKTLLAIEPSYQRTLSAKRSQVLISKLAAHFCWAHCAPLIVAANGPASWVIIDGQHRHQAALKRADIRDLPCYVVAAKDLAERAQAFVAHNRDRVALTSLALFHAGVAAGDTELAGVVVAAAAAGVAILKTPATVQTMAPNATGATGVMTRIWRDDGAARLTEVLTLIREAWPETHGQLRGRTIGAVAVILRQGKIARAALVKALRRYEGQTLEDRARALRTGIDLSLAEGYVHELVEAAGGDAMAAIAAMRGEERVKNLAQLKAIYDAKRPEREAAKIAAAEARAAEKRAKAETRAADRDAKATARASEQDAKARQKTEARKAVAVKKQRKAFQFDRSKPKAAAKPAPVEIRGDVKVRRFEMGASGVGSDEFLKRCGYEVTKRTRWYDVRKIGGNGRPVQMTHAELMEFLDQQRTARGLEPTNVKRSA
jgi:hypothetical protein